MKTQAQIQAQADFLQWFKANQPRAYHAAMQSGGLAGFSDTISKVFDTVTNTVAKLGTAYVQGKAAYELVKANIARAKQGLQPVNSIDEANQFPTQFQGGGMFGSIPPWVLYAGVGLIAVYLLKRR